MSRAGPVRARPRATASAIVAASWLLTMAGAASGDPAPGRSANSGLAAAESAYQQVDFESAYSLARESLAAGNASTQDTARLYVLLGTAAAALGKDAEAKDDFIVALAIDPSLHLARNLSPKMRGPYLEAQGFWGEHAERLAITAEADLAALQITTKLRDPAHLAAHVLVEVRRRGTKLFRTVTLAAEAEQHATVPRDLAPDGFEYFVRVVDAHGNALREVGSENEPLIARLTGAAKRIDEPIAAASPSRPARSLWLPATLATAGLPSIAAGVVFQLRRESKAREWNGPDCEHPGQSRIEQCADVNSARLQSERLAIGFYAAGAVLVGGSLVTYFAGSRGEPRTERTARELPFSIGFGPTEASVLYRGIF